MRKKRDLETKRERERANSDSWQSIKREVILKAVSDSL